MLHFFRAYTYIEVFKALATASKTKEEREKNRMFTNYYDVDAYKEKINQYDAKIESIKSEIITKETNQSARAQRNALIVEMKQDNPSITMQEIADLMGVNKSTVSRVLNKANS